MKKIIAIALTVISIISMSGCVGENFNKNLYNLISQEQYVEALKYYETNSENINFNSDVVSGNKYDIKTRDALLFNVYSVSNKLKESKISYEEANAYGELTMRIFPFGIPELDDETKKEWVDFADLLEKMSAYKEKMELINKGEYLKGLNEIVRTDALESDVVKNQIITELKALPVETVKQHINKTITEKINSNEVCDMPDCFLKNKDIIYLFLTEQEVADYISLINSTNEPKKCKFSACNYTKKDGYDYCSIHLCNTDGCKNGTADSYCSVHVCVKDGCNDEKAPSSNLCYSHLRKKQEGVTIGMSKEDVLDSSWGKPRKINKSTNKYGTREQWVYGNGNYLYFEDDRLTSIQN